MSARRSHKPPRREWREREVEAQLVTGKWQVENGLGVWGLDEQAYPIVGTAAHARGDALGVVEGLVQRLAGDRPARRHLGRKHACAQRLGVQVADQHQHARALHVVDVLRDLRQARGVVLEHRVHRCVPGADLVPEFLVVLSVVGLDVGQGVQVVSGRRRWRRRVRPGPVHLWHLPVRVAQHKGHLLGVGAAAEPLVARLGGVASEHAEDCGHRGAPPSQYGEWNKASRARGHAYRSPRSPAPG